jgi:hypothetical protein
MMRKLFKTITACLTLFFLLILLFRSITGCMELKLVKRLHIEGYFGPALAALLFLLLYLGISGVRKSRRPNLLVTAYFLIAFLTILQYDYAPHTVESDGVGYFTYLHSLYLDRDLDFTNEYKALDAVKNRVLSYSDPGKKEMKKTVTGYRPNAFSIGPSLLWLPFYAVTDFFYHHAHPERTGYEKEYVSVLFFSLLLYGFLGVLLLYHSLLRFFCPLASFLACWSVLFLSPLYAYMKSLPFFSHIYSFFCLSVFIFFFTKFKDSGKARHWFLYGLLIGFCTLMRWQNAVNLALPAIYALIIAVKNTAAKNQRLLLLTWRWSLLLVAFFLAITPQLAAFRIIYGHFFTIPQGSAFITFLPKWLLPVLFSPFHGVFYWHPVLIMGIIGFFIPYSGLKRILPNRNGSSPDQGDSLRTLSSGFGLQTYINASISQFWSGASFGNRRFIDALGFLAFGFANFFGLMWRHRITRYCARFMLLVFFLYNFFLNMAYGNLQVPHEEPVKIGVLWQSAWHSFCVTVKNNPRITLFLVLFIIFTHYLLSELREISQSRT